VTRQSQQHCLRQESGHKLWKDCVFRILKKVSPVEKEMIEARVQQSLFEPSWGLHRNVRFLVPKQNGKYRFISSGMIANRHTLEDAWIPADIRQFSEAFARLPILSLFDLHSGYE